MSKQAFLNNVGGKIVTAEEASVRAKEGYEDTYYCTGIVDGQICGAQMILAASYSTKRKPYFVSKNTLHLDGCPNYFSAKNSWNIITGKTSKKPEDVDILGIVGKNCKKSSQRNIDPPPGPDKGSDDVDEKEPMPVIDVYKPFGPPNNVKQLYHVLSLNSEQTKYPTGYQGVNHLIDFRSYRAYRSGQVRLNAVAMVIAGKCSAKKIYNQLPEERKLRWVLMDPYMDSAGKFDPRILYVLYFDDKKLFDAVLDKYFLNGKYKDSIYIIVGRDWNKMEDNVLRHQIFTVTVSSVKQIVPLKKEESGERLLRSPFKEYYE